VPAPNHALLIADPRLADYSGGMRVLLVNPAMNMKTLGKFQGLLEPMPVIGLAYIAGVLQGDGHEVKAIDQFTYAMGVETVIDQLKEFRPDVLGIGMLTPSTPVALAIANQAKAACPDLTIVAGNIHADIFYREILTGSAVDFVVHGEGEYTISELCFALERGESDFSGILGVSYLDGDVVKKTAARPVIEDLDALPLSGLGPLPLHALRPAALRRCRPPCALDDRVSRLPLPLRILLAALHGLQLPQARPHQARR
jgi:radical SAM superfamily enzyme YgiQ (UPF0313 family)